MENPIRPPHNLPVFPTLTSNEGEVQQSAGIRDHAYLTGMPSSVRVGVGARFVELAPENLTRRQPAAIESQNIDQGVQVAQDALDGVCGQVLQFDERRRVSQG